MIASGLVANGAKVYIAARKEEQLRTVGKVGTLERQLLTIYACKAAEELNRSGPGGCEIIPADLSVCTQSLSILEW